MDSKGVNPRYKACLIVSLMVLVWNVGAFGRRFIFDGQKIPFHFNAIDNESMPRAEEVIASPSTDCAVLHTSGKLTVKQGYLLGKRVDINKATLEEIADLPGISESVARAVVETRARLGKFKRVEDLLKVKGIKEKRLKKILPFLAQIHNN